ncbi:putative LRR receptor-like serine/threonine-protein kinase At3g47570 [Tasmannia lanceolata]|uniref:putative LRR receptor-like serine/threonine-protein kinase At3g47570 n=1 Tax=Tasmannia lanceolata TaxID=3420 RepID=UPI0040627CA8
MRSRRQSTEEEITFFCFFFCVFFIIFFLFFLLFRLILKSMKDSSSLSLSLKIITPFISFAITFIVLFWLRSLMITRKKSRFSLRLSSMKLRLRKISYAEIQSATDNFHSENMIGRGGFGSVYRGIIIGEQGTADVVAIKILDLKQKQASKSFVAECEALRSIRHRNLVKIITSCSSIDHSGADFKAVVMEFMLNGSLDEWLYPENMAGSVLSLIQRLDIAIDVAAAMDYLHHDCDPPIVHCDLKPSNVLLDNDMTAHVGDFGLARLLSQNHLNNQSSTIQLKGSIGYIAPEYGYGRKVSTSGDVYSFGILLLEIFTGKKPTDDIFQEGLNLKKFATAMYGNRVTDIVDPRLLEENYNSDSSIGISTNTSINSGNSNNNVRDLDWQRRKEECLAAVISVGLSCAKDLAKDRASMRETLTKLQEIKESLFQLEGTLFVNSTGN